MTAPDLHQQIRNRYNPDGSVLREAQSRMLEMLSFIDVRCVQNDIHHRLASSTLRGAVRHGGYMPWDDGTDIVITRQHYTTPPEAARRQHDVAIRFLPYAVSNP